VVELTALRRTPAVSLLTAGLAGLVLGGVTLLMQGTFPGFLNQLGNSGAVWSAAAFAAGALLPVRGWRAAVAGLILLVGAVVGYYGSTTVLLNDDVDAHTLRGPVVWAVVACVAGPVFGLAGAVWRGGQPVHRAAAAAALGAVFVAEGLYLLIVLRYVDEAVLMVGLGLLLPALLGRSGADRLRALAAVVPMTVLAGGALAVVFLFAQWVFRLPAGG
jgi:hypothetical protein